MMNDLSRLNYQNSQLRNKFDSNQATSVQLRRKDSLKSDKTRAIELERARLAQQNIELNEKLKDATTNISSLRESLILKDASTSQLIAKLHNEMNSEVLKRDESISQVTQHLSDANVRHENEIERLKYSMEKEQTSLTEEINALKQELQYSRDEHDMEISQLFNTLEKVEHDRDGMQGKQRDYDLELSQMKDDLDAANQDHEAELSRIQKDFITYQSTTQAEKDKLKHQLQITKDELKQCQSDLRHNSSEDVIFLRGTVNKAHGEIRKVKLEMDALKALHERENDKMKAEAKKGTAPCRRCMWQTNMQKAKAVQRNKAIEQVAKKQRASQLQKKGPAKWEDSSRTPYDSDSE